MSKNDQEYAVKSTYKKMNDATRVVQNKIVIINRSLDLIRKNDRESMGLDTKAELSKIIDQIHEIQDSLSVLTVSTIEELWRR